MRPTDLSAKVGNSNGFQSHRTLDCGLSGRALRFGYATMKDGSIHRGARPQFVGRIAPAANPIYIFSLPNGVT